MRILHVAKYYYPYAGGMESIVRDLCEGLASKGHEVTVLCSHDKWNYEEDYINGVKVIRLPRLGVVFGQNINLRALITLKLLASKVDVVHLHTPNPLFEFASLFIPKSTPVVCTYHSDIVRQKFLLKFYRPIFNKVLKRMKAIYVPTVNHILHSEFLKNIENKCRIVPFGIHTNHLKSSEDSILAAKEFRSKFGPYCIFIGRLVGYKGIPVLIEAMKGLDRNCVIIGDGPDRELIEMHIKEHGLEKKVHLMGKVFNDTKFSGLIYGSEFLVLPSITPNENFGIVQLEAMACSKPVVTTRLKSGVPAVGEEGVTTLLANPGDVSDLHEKMKQLFNSVELKREMGVNARKRFDALYTYENMISVQDDNYQDLFKFEELYEELKAS